MPIPYEPGAGDPRDLLRDFLAYVRDLLDELTSDGEPLFAGPVFVRAHLIPALANAARAAWTDARSMFETVSALIGRSDVATDSALDQNGLRGAQLAFKLEVVRFFNEQYSAIGRGALKKLIDVIDILLKSILAVVGAGEGASEIKDYIKESLDLGG